MYVLSNIKIKYGQSAAFSVSMAEVKKQMELRGWLMIGAYTAVIGDFTQVTHIWKVEGGDHVTSSLFDATGDPAVMEAMAGLAEVTLEESIQLVVPMPYLDVAP